MNGSHHDVDICEKTRNIDKLLYKYENDREIVVNLMKNDRKKLIRTLWKKNESPISIDDECRPIEELGFYRSIFACSQCKNVERLLTDEDEITIQCGEREGTKLKVEREDIFDLFIEDDYKKTKRANYYICKYQKLFSCGVPSTSIMNVVSDSFTSKILVTWMCMDISDSILDFYSAYVCNSSGFIIKSDSIPFSELIQYKEYQDDKGNLDYENTWTIISQLIEVLHSLSSLYFTHGDPTIDHLRFDVEDGIKLKLVISPYSTVTVNDARYSSSSDTERVEYLSPEFQYRVGKCDNIVPLACPHGTPCSLTTNKYRKNRETYYKLNNTTYEIFNSMRNLGVSLFSGSFDLYCFFLCLMKEEKFRTSAKSDYRSFQLWGHMWDESDLNNIEDELNEDPIEIVKGKWLRCDIVEWMYKLVKYEKK